MENEDCFKYCCKEGLEKYEAKNYKESISIFSKAIEINPTSAEVFTMRGLSYSYIENYTDAISDFSKSIQIDPHNDEVYVNRGNAYKNINVYSKAFADYSKAIQINPENSDAYYNRGNLFLLNQDYNNAVIDYNKAIELNPEDSDFYRNRAAAYTFLGKTNESYENLQISDRLGNEVAKSILASIESNLMNKSEEGEIYSYDNKGAEAFDSENYSEAIFYWGKVVAIDPKIAVAHFNLGLAYSRIGDYSNAFSAYSKAIAINSKYSQAYFGRGASSILLNGYSQSAIEDFKIAASLGNSEALKMLEYYEHRSQKDTELKLLKFNGLYYAKQEDGYIAYLRFYSDGTVLSVTSSGNPKDLQSWFKKESFGTQGKFNKMSDNIEFIVESSSGRVSYKGKIISKTELQFNIKSYINGHESVRLYSFVEFTETITERANTPVTSYSGNQNIRSNNRDSNINLFDDLFDYFKYGIYSGAIFGFLCGFVGCFIKLSPNDMPLGMPFTYSFYGAIIGAAGGFISCIIKNSITK